MSLHPVRPPEAPHPPTPERAAVQLPVREGLHFQLWAEDPLEDYPGVRSLPRRRGEHEQSPRGLGGSRKRDADERR